MDNVYVLATEIVTTLKADQADALRIRLEEAHRAAVKQFLSQGGGAMGDVCVLATAIVTTLKERVGTYEDYGMRKAD